MAKIFTVTMNITVSRLAHICLRNGIVQVHVAGESGMRRSQPLAHIICLYVNGIVQVQVRVPGESGMREV